MLERTRCPVPRSRLRVLATVLAVCVAASAGCGGRTVTAVELEPIVFSHEDAPIPGTIELCLARELRMRQWNVRSQPYVIELGDRAALNVERLAKAAFESVVVSFEEPCGGATQGPWLSATILAANRETDSIWSRSQETTITLDLELVSESGAQIWNTRTRGVVTKEPAALTRRRIRAAQDFGEAIQRALETAFQEIIESEAIRRTFTR